MEEKETKRQRDYKDLRDKHQEKEMMYERPSEIKR